MRWRLILALCLLLLPSLAQAVHTHEHRYVVMGRVLDAEGLPAGQVSLRVELVGTEAFVPAQAPRTNCLGDFATVFAIDDLSGAEVQVTVQGQSVTAPVEPVLRRTFVPIQGIEATSPADCQPVRESFEQRHVVLGRLIGTDGQPVSGQSVNVTLELAGSGQLAGNGTTNQAGDFAVVFRSPRLGQGGTAVVSAPDARWQVPLDEEMGITVADHVAEPSRVWAWLLVGGVIALGLAAYPAYRWLQDRSSRRAPLQGPEGPS